MTEYINMWKNYANFSARTTKRGYWMAVLFGMIAAIIVTVLDRILGFGGYKYVTTSTSVSMSGSMGALSSILSLAMLIPGLAITVRRLRDAGKSWKNLFLLFIPLVGVIIVIVQLCKASVADDGTLVV
jgi:uncharacterized membrane protein YhaH (DUF805 family)